MAKQKLIVTHRNDESVNRASHLVPWDLDVLRIQIAAWVLWLHESPPHQKGHPLDLSPSSNIPPPILYLPLLALLSYIVRLEEGKNRALPRARAMVMLNDNGDKNEAVAPLPSTHHRKKFQCHRMSCDIKWYKMISNDGYSIFLDRRGGK